MHVLALEASRKTSMDARESNSALQMLQNVPQSTDDILALSYSFMNEWINKNTNSMESIFRLA